MGHHQAIVRAKVGGRQIWEPSAARLGFYIISCCLDES